MKMFRLLFGLLFIACASGDGFVDDGVRLCGAGDPIEINAGFQQAPSTGPEGYSESLTLLVEIANNSDEDILIEGIRVDPISPMQGGQRYELQGGRIEPRQVIAEADAELFEVPMSARRLTQYAPRGFSGVAEVAVTVELEGSDSYRCRFRLGR